MATNKALEALKKTNDALDGIKEKIEPVLQRLNDDGFGEKTPEAKATIALSVGMMRYMGARLRGLDQGRQKDDPLRKELDNMRKVLAEIKKRQISKEEKKVKEPPQKKESTTEKGDEQTPAKTTPAKAKRTEPEPPSTSSAEKKRKGKNSAGQSKKKRSS